MGTAALQVVVLFIIVAVGFVSDKLKFYTEKTAKATTKLLFYVITPTVIVRSFLTMEYSKEKLGGFLIALACAIGTHICGIILSIPFFNKLDTRTGTVYKFASIFGNMGYMGLPLAQSVVGPMGVFYCSAGVVAYNILVFTYGSWMFLRHKEGYKFSPKSLILNPGIIAVSIGIPLFIFGIKMPSFLDSATQHIANMNTPLAMLLLGTYISNADIKTLFKQKENYLVLLLKQICMPLIMITIYRLLGFEGDLLTSIGISCCVPCATNTVMFAGRYDADTRTAAKVVAFCTFMAIFTMPFMIAYTKL
jgi:predicted permease